MSTKDLTDEQVRFLWNECQKPPSDTDLKALAQHDPDPPDDSHKAVIRSLAAELLQTRKARDALAGALAEGLMISGADLHALRAWHKHIYSVLDAYAPGWRER